MVNPEDDNMKSLLEKIQYEILDLETKTGALDLKLNNVKIWQALRTPIYYDIAKRAGIFNTIHTVKNSFSERAAALPSFLYSSLFFNPLFSRKKRDVLVFDHSRKVPENGRYIDIHTQYMIERFDNENVNYEVFEEQYLNRHFTSKTSRRKHMDFIQICANIYAHFRKTSFSEIETSRIREIESEILARLNIEMDLVSLFRFEVSRFKAYCYFYRKIIERRKPRTVYLLVGYGHPYLIKAAKDLHVETIEIQHGTISEFHLGYYYPHVSKGSLEYFPDKIYLWDDFWKYMCTFPIEEENIIIAGFEHLDRLSSGYHDVNKKKLQIAVISQGSVGPQIAEMILRNIEELKDCTIIYKLHPGEYDRWREYDSLRELQRYPNVEIVDNNRKPLYRILAESQYVVGVYSTAIFESLRFGCRIILLNIAGIEYMYKFAEVRKIPILDKTDSICAHLDSSFLTSMS